MILIKKILIAIIKLYKFAISPIFPSSCRFYPTCSSYSIEAIEKFGAGKGSILAVKRIFKCHPFHPGGYDPVPNHTNHK